MSARTMRGGFMKNREGGYYKGQPDDETRQQYVNARIRELQQKFIAANEVLPFDVLLHAFRCYGVFYDDGFRLRDLEVAA